ncbi:hypothetical protein LguiA_009359 [Lonicera macranthoides]
MAKSSSQDFASKRHFHWTNKVSSEDEEQPPPPTPTPPPFNSSSPNASHQEKKETDKVPAEEPTTSTTTTKKKLQAVAISKWRSVLTALRKNQQHHLPHGLGPRVVGTLFGNRRGHVHFALQRDSTSQPAFLVELATPITGLVKEMASGLVRIALECDKEEKKPGPVRLLEEPIWRTFCNGKKCGFATRRECGPKDWKVLKAVEPISMGAGVLPGLVDEEGGESDGEIMYMRAKFERVVGSRDSEAFYMMNPDSNGAPELSIYLLRV